MGLTPGMRAFAIRVNGVFAIPGIIVPNTRVDILVTVEQAVAETRVFVSKPLMTNVRVLAYGVRQTRDVDRKRIDAYIVTIEVTPEEAEILARADSQGTLSVAFRSDGRGAR